MPPELYHCRFLKACRCEPVDRIPVWLMRQAGRFLPEYMRVRRQGTFLELCENPARAAEVTLTARARLGVDAAILFADLLPILQPMGFSLEYAQGEGPIIHNPLGESGDVERVREVEDPGALGHVMEAVRLIRRDLPADIPLLGFGGAPFTLASYAIEGGGSRHYVRTKQWMYAHPEAWRVLMQKLARSLARHLNGQIAAGCQAVQIFDSWAGCLSPGDYARFALPYTQELIASLPSEVPVIHFLTGNPALLRLQRRAGGTVIGLDWRHDLGAARRELGPGAAVQGNLDPAVLLGPREEWGRQARALLEAAGRQPGYIFNLGHGVLPETDPEQAIALVQMVHDWAP